MIDFDAMVKNEDMADVILFLVGRKNEGIAYPSIDRFFGRHKAAEKYEAYNIRLIHEITHLEEEGQIYCTRTNRAGCRKGPNWKEPVFMTEKKYGIS